MENQIRTTEYNDDRVYWCPNEKKEEIPIVSVTTNLGIIDKPFLATWRGDIGNREADLRVYESQNRGKRIHYAWAQYVMGGTVIFNPWDSPKYTEKEVDALKASTPFFFELRNQDEMVALWKLQRFFEIVKPKVLHSELTVYSIPHNEAGTLDNAFLIEAGMYDVNGSKKLIIPQTGIYIADLKSGKIVDGKTVWMQMAPYMNCYERMGYGTPVGALCLHTSSLNKSGILGFGVTLKMASDMRDDYQNYKYASYLWKSQHPNFKPKEFQFPIIIKRNIS